MNRTIGAVARRFLLITLIGVLTACGGEELSDARSRFVRQSPFLTMAPGATQLASIDINRFRQLSIYSDFREIFLRDEGRLSVWNELSRRQGGADPLSQIDKIVFAGHAPSFDRPMNDIVLIITGNWTDNEKFLEAIQLMSAEGFLDNPPPFESFQTEFSQNAYQMTATSTMHPGEQVTIYTSFPGDGICVFSLSEERFGKCNDAIYERNPAITDDEGWDDHFSRIRLDQPIWIAGWAPNFEWREFMEEQVQTVPELDGLWDLVHNHPAVFYAYLETEGRYLFNMEAICENEKAGELFEIDLNKARRVIPRMLNNIFNGDIVKIDRWKALIDEIEVRREGASLFFSLEMNEEEVSNVIEITSIINEATPTPKPLPDPFRRRD